MGAAYTWSRLIARWLERFVVRLVLSIAIIVSLIPVGWVDRFDLLFLGIFGTEFVLRVFTVVMASRVEVRDDGLGAHHDPRSVDPGDLGRRAGTWVLLLIDFVALMSFIPWTVDAEGARWLRVFRLTRMLLLVGYWAPLVRDLWTILLRRERARQLILMAVVVGGLSFVGAVILYYIGGETLDVTDDGVVDAADHSFLNLLWWSFRQVQDPGNMLSSPMAVPVVVISVMLTVFGLFLVSFLIGLGTDVVRELLELSRLRPAGLKGHTVIINITPSTQRLLRELLRYYRKLLPSDARPLSAGWFSDLRRRGFSGARYLIVGSGSDPPVFARQPEFGSIVYRQRPEDEEELIKRADLLVAKRIVCLADQNDSDPDAETIRSLVTLVERVRDKERSPEHALGDRQRVVIAEVLDESNVSAAQAALITGADTFRGFIVPTEKLLALFFASVVRRPGLGTLLEELLTSHGHEIYTCFFDTPGLGFSLSNRPEIGTNPTAALDRILDAGLRRPEPRSPVIPLGLLTDRKAAPGEPDFNVHINPDSTGADAGEGGYRGFIAVADNFRSIRELADALKSAPEPEAPRSEVVYPELARTHRRKTTRVLVCGFRAGSVYMLEELFRSDPGGEILVILESAGARDRALEALEAHSQLVRSGLLHNRHGVFKRDELGTRLHFSLPGEDGAPSVMHLCVADWMASRHLVELPAGFGHVADLDSIVFVAADRDNADKRTTTALLKLEQLFAGKQSRPRVVAEVIDGRLATRLEQRCIALGIGDVRVFSIQELRAYFLFQSVVVPGFDSVYAELLGSWGQSFVHLDVAAPSQGMCTYEALARHLRSQGQVLVGVEVHTGDGERLCVAPGPREPGARFDIADLRGAWVIAPDSGRKRAPDALSSHVARSTAE